MGLGAIVRFVVLCVLFTLSQVGFAFHCAHTALMAGQASVASMGDMVSHYDKELETRLYYGLSEPDRRGVIPLVGKDASAVAIYLHGTGTAKAGGKGFIHRMQNLMSAGVAPLSFDLPFHSEGPRRQEMHDINVFMEWIHKIITRVQAYGKPIYFIGHSFGPVIAMEYAARYPKDIKGALLISACLNRHPASRWTFDNITVPGMPLFLDKEQIMTNEAGGNWGDIIFHQTTYERSPVSETEFVFLRGEDDEWFPENAWLPKALGVKQIWEPRVIDNAYKRKFPNAKFIFIPKVGHYIFEAKAENGKNAILDSAFNLMGVPENRRYAPAPAERSARTQLAALQYNSPIFADWVGTRYTPWVRDERHAYDALLGWNDARLKMWIDLLEKMPGEHPEFYAARKISHERLLHEAKDQLENLKSGRKQQEVSAHTVPWSDQATFFQGEFSAYVQAKTEGRELTFDADPLALNYPVDPALVTAGKMTSKGIKGPITEEAARQTITEAGGEIFSVERNGDSTVARLGYRVDGRNFVVNVIERGKGIDLIREAFLQGCRENQWTIITHRFEVEVRGVKVRGLLKSGTLSDFEITDVGSIELHPAGDLN